jgi:hypothetical protein
MAPASDRRQAECRRTGRGRGGSGPTPALVRPGAPSRPCRGQRPPMARKRQLSIIPSVGWVSGPLRCFAAKANAGLLFLPQHALLPQHSQRSGDVGGVGQHGRGIQPPTAPMNASPRGGPAGMREPPGANRRPVPLGRSPWSQAAIAVAALGLVAASVTMLVWRNSPPSRHLASNCGLINCGASLGPRASPRRATSARCTDPCRMPRRLRRSRRPRRHPRLRRPPLPRRTSP